jgi:hypothetical protein
VFLYPPWFTVFWMSFEILAGSILFTVTVHRIQPSFSCSVKYCSRNNIFLPAIFFWRAYDSLWLCVPYRFSAFVRSTTMASLLAGSSKRALARRGPSFAKTLLVSRPATTQSDALYVPGGRASNPVASIRCPKSFVDQLYTRVR